MADFGSWRLSWLCGMSAEGVLRMKKSSGPNPQGKGLSPSLGFLVESVRELSLPVPAEDSVSRLVEDYLNSSFVLSCDFRFRPVRGRRYYIYSHHSTTLLSLIGPREGGERIYENYLGRCHLTDDFSWSVAWASNSPSMVNLHTDIVCESDISEPDMDDVEMVTAILETILAGKVGRRDKRLGYYQNGLNYVLGRNLYSRSRGLIESGLLGVDESSKPCLQEFER